MVFCNKNLKGVKYNKKSHNPYFSRWFSAIENKKGIIYIGNAFSTVTILILVDGFLQFNQLEYILNKYKCHNPYFSRWFSAMTSIIV